MANLNDPPVREQFSTIVDDKGKDAPLRTITSRTWIRWFTELKALVERLSTGSGFIFTASRALESDSGGNLVASAVTATELNYLDGVTSAIQTQIDAKTPKGYGGISVTGNSTDTALAAQDTWYQYTLFGTNDPSSGTTPDHTNDHITIGTTGVYFVTIVCSFSGSASTQFHGQVYKNNGATALANVHFERMLGAGGDIGSASGAGIVSLTAGDTVEFWVSRLTGGAVSKDFRGTDVTLSIVRLS